MRYIKSCGFVVFKRIDNANYYLLVESKKEEEFLQELIERQLQGKDV